MADQHLSYHYLQFGNPVVHEPVAEKGQIVQHVVRADIGKQTTQVFLPWDAHTAGDGLGEAAVISANAERALAVMDEHGVSSWYLRLLNDEVRKEPWELAFRHMLLLCSTQGRAGFDWVDCADDAVKAALVRFFDAADGEQGGYGQEPPAGPVLPTIAGGSPDLDVRQLLEDARTDGERQWALRAAGITGPTALKMKKGYDVFLGALNPSYMALSPSAAAPVNTNTTLAEEIVTAEGGLGRKAASYAHTTETTTGEIKATFTANSHDALPVKVKKFAAFTAITAGTMLVEDEVTETPFNLFGDNATVTDVFTLS